MREEVTPHAQKIRRRGDNGWSHSYRLSPASLPGSVASMQMHLFPRNPHTTVCGSTQTAWDENSAGGAWPPGTRAGRSGRQPGICNQKSSFIGNSVLYTTNYVL